MLKQTTARRRNSVLSQQQQLSASLGQRIHDMARASNRALSSLCCCGDFILRTVVLGCILFFLNRRRTGCLRAFEACNTVLMSFGLTFLVSILDSLFVMVLGRFIDSFLYIDILNLR
jgi:hypothetical protein